MAKSAAACQRIYSVNHSGHGRVHILLIVIRPCQLLSIDCQVDR